MRTSLRAKKKYGFIGGTIKEPADKDPDLENWWAVNSILVLWICNTIKPTIRRTITHVEVTKDLWEDIKQCFFIGNGPLVQQVWSDLANCKQNGQTAVVYFGRLKFLWEELSNYDQILVCTCADCRWNLTTELVKKREEERVHHFLMGLDEEGLGTVRSNILSTEPMPT